MKFCTPALLLGVGFAVGYFPWVPTLLRIPDHLLTEQLSSTVPLPDDPQASLQVSSTFLHASRLAGWRHRTKFATFLQMDDAEQLLNMPQRQTGSFLIVIPGKSDAQSQPPRRKDGHFLTLLPSASRVLNSTLPTQALETLAAAIEKIRGGRKIHAFTIELSPKFVHCFSGQGACAIWEGSTGRIILDEGLATRMAQHKGLGLFLSDFISQFSGQLSSNAQEEDYKEKLKVGGLAMAIDLLPALFAKTAAASMASVAMRHLPFWCCVTCPLVLGMLAPFIWNFGLTAAAEQLCTALQLPNDTCNDLWWAAFALALVMSLGSAIPIVYVCKLRDCGGRHLGISLLGATA